MHGEKRLLKAGKFVIMLLLHVQNIKNLLFNVEKIFELMKRVPGTNR